MIRVAVVGLGKMGLSHLAMIRPHPKVDLVGVCDSAAYLLDVLNKNTGVPTFTDYDAMLATTQLDAVIIATPSHLHAPMVRKALLRDLHVFCEKPLFLDPVEGAELTAMAQERGLVTQVGYHNKFVGAFREVKRLLEFGAIGAPTTVLAEAYGPVVLKPQGRSWRTKRNSGGGCLYDYAAHPLDLVAWYLGEPTAIGGSRLTSIFSRETDDAVTATLFYPDGVTAELLTNWSDESQRKMTTKVTVWGTEGRIYADRQEVQVFLRDSAPIPEGYQAGWNTRYTTELTEPTWFYLRGEEYSAQLDEFVNRVEAGLTDGLNTFTSASVTDRIIAGILTDAERGPTPLQPPVPDVATGETQGVDRRVDRGGARGTTAARLRLAARDAGRRVAARARQLKASRKGRR